ncbi:hypothetical protein U1Q18_009209 [Sarracenia purpurea var. burkii]
MGVSLSIDRWPWRFWPSKHHLPPCFPVENNPLRSRRFGVALNGSVSLSMFSGGDYATMFIGGDYACEQSD